MRVAILKDIFEKKDNYRDLDRLWNTIENRHKLFLKDEEDIEGLMESDWFDSQRETIQQEIYELIVFYLQNSSKLNPNITISNEPNPEYFSIREADRYLKETFVILLENSLNDGHFVDALIKCFPKYGSLIQEHKEEGWLEYGMGGGTTIKEVIVTKLTSYTSEIFTKPKFTYLRYFVILDSDKKYPEMELESGKIRLVHFLEENKIPFHILEKREMENYLPNKVIDSILDNRELIDAYLRLSPIQKDYFDLQKTFSGKEFRKLQLLEEFQELYRDVSEEDVKIFRKNSFNQIYQHFKSEFPKLFQHPLVTKGNLLKRCEHHSNNPEEHPYNPNELPDLLKKIIELL